MGSAIFGSFPGAKLGHQYSRVPLPLSGHTKSFVDFVAGTVDNGRDGRLLPFSVSIAKHSG